MINGFRNGAAVAAPFLCAGMKRQYWKLVARWRWFQNTYPDLQNVMQLKDVASFLGMTPVTLSRIRAKQSEAAEDT